LKTFLLEPAPRGTASVVGLAAAILHQRDPQAMMAILPSDHYIRDRDLFHYILRVAADVAEKDYLVTLGIAPTFAATGYGYIQRGAPLAENFNYPVYTVSRFKEKPDEAAARQMLTPATIPGIRACSSGKRSAFWLNSALKCPNSKRP
jgi:mannose-1-phosphate guanylyltransferase